VSRREDQGVSIEPPAGLLDAVGRVEGVRLAPLAD
jgi:hypothetical protein